MAHNFSTQEVAGLIALLQNHTSKQTVIGAADLAAQLNQTFPGSFPPGGNEQKTRALVKYAIEKGHLIKSSTNPGGFWLSNNKLEIIKNIDSLKRRAQKTHQSSDSLKATWNFNNPTDIIP